MVHKGPAFVAAATPGFPSVEDPPDMDSMGIPQLIELLQSLFQAAEFQKAESALMSREASLKAAIESSLSEELAVKEVERMELVARIEGLERDLGVLKNKCSDLGLRLSESGERFGVEMAELELQLRVEKERYSLLEARLQDLDARKLGSDEEIEKYKRSCERLEDEIARLKEACGVASEKENRAQELIATLLETQEEQGDTASWRQKCKELEARVSQLEDENRTLIEKGRMIEEKEKLVKAWILPDMEVVSNGKANLPAKGKGNTALDGVIEIIDSDDEFVAEDCEVKENMMEGALDTKNESITDKSCKVLHSGVTRNLVVQEDDKIHKDGVLPIPTPKRKRISRIVTSDSEDDDEDNIPIGKLKLRALRQSKDVVEENNGPSDAVDMVPSRKRLVLLRELYESDIAAKGKSPGNPSTPYAKGITKRKKATTCRKLGYSESSDDEPELDDVSSDSEGESLGGFLVGESDSPESGASSESSSSEEEADSDIDLDSVLAGIRREKVMKNWEFEADMLASFSKDPELCMKSVCALYRQQTLDEQSVKESLLQNRRGFNKIDAQRGSMLAEFLTDGDPSGQLKKTVHDLEKYDPKGPEYCHKLATRYSKQLFSIYQNKEDPFFQPS